MLYGMIHNVNGRAFDLLNLFKGYSMAPKISLIISSTTKQVYRLLNVSTWIISIEELIYPRYPQSSKNFESQSSKPNIIIHPTLEIYPELILVSSDAIK